MRFIFFISLFVHTGRFEEKIRVVNRRRKWKDNVTLALSLSLSLSNKKNFLRVFFYMPLTWGHKKNSFPRESSPMSNTNTSTSTSSPLLRTMSPRIMGGPSLKSMVSCTRKNEAHRHRLCALRERILNAPRRRKHHRSLEVLPNSLMELVCSFLELFDHSALLGTNRILNRFLHQSRDRGLLSPSSVHITPRLLASSPFASVDEVLRCFRHVQHVVLADVHLAPLRLTDTTLHLLSKLSNLQTLEIEQYIDTSSTSYSFKSLQCLSILSSLTSLSVANFFPPLREAIHLSPWMRHLHFHFDDSEESKENDLGLAALCSLKHLQTITLCNTPHLEQRITKRIIQILESLSPSLTDVKVYNLQGCMTPLKSGSLPSVRRLTLDHAAPSDLFHFLPLPSLTSLTLSGVYAATELVSRYLAALPPLTSLSLRNISLYDESDLATCLLGPHSSSLRTLSLRLSHHSEVDLQPTYDTIRSISSLTSLTFEDWTVDFAKWILPTPSSSLTHLDINWESVTQSELALVVSRCSFLRVLNITSYDLDDGWQTLSPLICPSNSSSLQHLQNLSLLYCLKTDDFLPVVEAISSSSSLSSLRTLTLVSRGTHSPFTTSTLSAIEQLRTRGCAVHYD